MRAFIAKASFLFTVACGPALLPPIPEPSGPLVKDNLTLSDVGLDGSAMDRSVNPCADFHQFACGGWQAKTSIPPDQPRWMRSFSVIHKRNQEDLKQILEAAAEGADDPIINKLGDFYAGCMDEAAIELAEWKAIDPVWSLLAPLTLQDAPAADEEEPTAPIPLERMVARLHEHGIWVFFTLDAAQDKKNATATIAQIDQGGLGLPDRAFYLDDGERMEQIRAFYRGHVGRMQQLVGDANTADTVMRIETELAKVSKTRVERRDPEGTYNKIGRRGLRERKAGFDWDEYFQLRGLDGVQDVNVTSLQFIDGLGMLLSRLSNDELRAYLSWHILHELAPAMPARFVGEDFKLQQKLYGAKEQKPRWKRCIEMTDHWVGEILAQPYVAKRFTAESKQAVESMVTEVGRAFRRSLSGLAWMDDVTREHADAKLDKMAYLIGYPDEWRKYDFDVDRKTHMANTLRARLWERTRDKAKIGKPIDRGEWFMTPQTVNAYYSPSRNQMVFPAGILQPPFFDAGATIAVNMGAMGMVVGHELTHGFDDKGSKFDGDGNLSGWWAPDVRNRFDAQTKCVEDQYAAYEVLPGVTLNGKLTLGENIADAGGVKLAFHAYRLMREEPAEVYVAEGFNEDQQFFISLAQVWCFKYREAFARARATTDSHSQPNWRVNGALRNTPEFAEAFQCPDGSAMKPAAACSVW